MNITKKQHACIMGKISEFLNQWVPAYTMSIDDVLKAYWTDEEIKMAKAVPNFVGEHCLRISGFDPCITGCVEHDLLRLHEEDAQRSVHVPFNFSAYGPQLWPHDHLVAPYHCDRSKALYDGINNILHGIFEISVLGQCFDFVLDNCSTHEQARYIFPPYLALLHYAEYPEIASSIEQVKRAQPMPGGYAEMRPFFKHAIQKFAEMMLLGKPEPIPLPSDHCIVTMQGNYSVEAMNSVRIHIKL